MVNLTTENMHVRYLIDGFSKGTIAIPEFQREYVWKPAKVVKLIDSIYRSYPTGTLLVWKPKLEERVTRKGKKKATGQVYWLIDGQQRTRSLYESLKEGNISIYFDPISESFCIRKKSVENSSKHLSLIDLLEGTNYLSIKKSLRESFPESESRIELAIDKCRAILDYEIPMVVMHEHSLEDAINAFERINTSGTRLKSADISTAKLSFSHTGFVNKRVTPLIGWLRNKGFDRIYSSQLFMACSAIAKASPKKIFNSYIN